MTRKITFTSPLLRYVGGSLYTGDTKNDKGEELKFADGSPRTSFWFICALPKRPGETHWKQSSFGKLIWDHAHAEYPALNENKFSFKVSDGDEVKKNDKTGEPMPIRDGYAGCWIFRFGGSFLPKLVNATGTAMLNPDVKIRLGDYIQVSGSVEGNGNTQQPGVYVNYEFVAYNRQGQEIVIGRSAEECGFGVGVEAPADSTPVPENAAAPTFGGTTTHASDAPPAPGATAAVAPNEDILDAAPPPPGDDAPPPPPAEPVRKMTAKATTSYAAYIKAGWTDEALVKHGMMEPV